MTGSDGETLPNSEFRFSPEGYPIFTYQTKSRLKEAVLTTVVETIKFVPPRGGVTYITVESLSVSPESVDYAVSMSHERAGGVLTQSSGTLVAEFSLAGNGLDVALMEQENTTVSQPGIVIPGDGSQIVYRGTLHKVG
ncbi:MAG TPA: hypothetical protein VLA17_10715 [Candidatus Limnocylindria bacterium]|nr:hypothetical protein [Candidatus Limnocylindria bacterium]